MWAEGIILAKSLISNLLRACAIVHCAMWQCKIYNLVANFRTNASDITWSPRNQNIQCEWNTKLILRNTENLKLTNTRAYQSRSSGQREQTLLTVSWFLCLPEEVGHVHAHLWLQAQVHDHHHHRSPKWPHSSPGWDSEREPCVLTKEDMSWTFTILAIMVLDVNFNNPYKHLSSIVPPKTRILGPQKGDLLAPRIRTCVTNPSTSDCLLTLSDTCMLYIFRKLSSASTSLTKN